MSRSIADGPLGEVQAFCNTAVFLYEQDAFATRDGVGDWLGRRCTEAERAQIVRVREALRTALEAGFDDAGVLNEVLAGTRFAWESGRPSVSGDPVARVVGLAFAQHLRGDLTRLKVCRAQECRWVFHDRSPNQASVWCAMEICGSRHKMRAYRGRRSR